jgi:hypothetical protein
MGFIHVAECDNIASSGLQSCTGNVHSPPATADQRRSIPLVFLRGYDIWDSGGETQRQRSLQESSTVYTHAESPGFVTGNAGNMCLD